MLNESPNLWKQKKAIDQILRENIRPRSLLIVGENQVGKSTLMSYYEGVPINYSHPNEDDVPTLVDLRPAEQRYSFSTRFNLSVDFRIVQIDDVCVLQMPWLIFNSERLEQNQLVEHMLRIYIWQAVFSMCDSIQINIIFPYSYLMDVENLKNFFQVWESLLASDIGDLEKISGALSITLSKLEYEDDKDEFIMVINNVLENQASQNLKAVMNSVISNERITCFLTKQMESQTEGKQLFETVTSNSSFLQLSSCQFLSENWLDLPTKLTIAQGSENDLQVIMQMNKSEQIMSEPLKILSLISASQLLNYFKADKNESGQIKQVVAKVSQEISETCDCVEDEEIVRLAQSMPIAQPFDEYYDSILLIHRAVTTESSTSDPFTIMSLIHSLQSIYFQGMHRTAEAKAIEVFKSRMQQWLVFLQGVERMCLNLAGGTEMEQKRRSYLQNCKKQFCGKIKSNFCSWLAANDFFQKLKKSNDPFSLHSSFGPLEQMYEAHVSVQGKDEGSDDDSGSLQCQSDDRIKRVYAKSMESEKLKQATIKLSAPSAGTVKYSDSDRENVKRLLKNIENASNSNVLYQNLYKLHEKAIQYSEFSLAAVTLLELLEIEEESNDDEAILMKMVRFMEDYFVELKKMPNAMNEKSKFTVLIETIIPFLQTNSAVYRQYNRGLVYYKLLVGCYDFLAVETCENAEEFQELNQLTESAAVPNPNQSFIFETNNLKDMNCLQNKPEQAKTLHPYSLQSSQNPQNKTMTLKSSLNSTPKKDQSKFSDKYLNISESKGQIVAKITEDEKRKWLNFQFIEIFQAFYHEVLQTKQSIPVGIK